MSGWVMEGSVDNSDKIVRHLCKAVEAGRSKFGPRVISSCFAMLYILRQIDTMPKLVCYVGSS